MSDIEDRLRATLREVASRVPADVELPEVRRRARRRGPLLVAAAALVAVVAAAVLARDGDDGRQVVTGPAAPGVVIRAEIDEETYEVVDEGERNGRRCVHLRVAGARRGPSACVSSERLAIAVEWVTTGGRTAVFGLAHDASTFDGRASQVATATFQQVALGDGGAFLLAWDVAGADGVVTATDGRRTVEAPFGGGPSGAPEAYAEPLPASRRGRPGELAAVSADGRLVVLDTGTGAERRELARVPGPRGIDGVALSPDGRTVWFSVCCEPAGGTVLRVPFDGSAPPEEAGFGFDPTFGSSSRYVAMAWDDGLQVIDPVGDFGRRWISERWSGDYQEVAWSLDGGTFVLRVGAGELVVVPFDAIGFTEAETGGDADAARLLPGDSWSSPVFRRDGLLVAADGDAVRVIDVATGEVVDELDVSGNLPVLDLDYDATGEWLLAVVEGGAVQMVGRDGTVTALDVAVRLAAW